MDFDDDSEPDFDDDVTQWTATAREQYASAARTAIERLREHTGLTLARRGDPAEQERYLASAELLDHALNRLSDAEFDWSGSFPFVLEGVDDEFEELTEPDEPEAQEHPGLTVEYRARLEVLDADALLAAGRAAYRRVWPEDTEDEAAQTVSDPATAVAQLIHADGMGSLRSADHLHELWGELSISSDREPAPPGE